MNRLISYVIVAVIGFIALSSTLFVAVSYTHLTLPTKA